MVRFFHWAPHGAEDLDQCPISGETRPHLTPDFYTELRDLERRVAVCGRDTGQVMSQENVEAARRLYNARNRGDVEAVVRECHPQVEWHPHLSSLGGQPVRGHAGIRKYLRSLADEWATFRHEPEDFFDVGDSVVAFLHTRAVGRTSGVEVDMPVAHLLRFESGRCIKSVSYIDRSQALEAAGLSE